MEDEVVGEILKSDVKKEDDTAPPVALWDSWFHMPYRLFPAEHMGKMVRVPCLYN